MALAKQARPRETTTLNDVFEAERGLVGLILADPATYGVMAQILRDEDWTHPLHRGVFEVAGALVAAGEAITLAAVLPRVADVGPDGTPAEAYLAARIAGAPAASEAEPLARRLAAAADIRDRPDPYSPRRLRMGLSAGRASPARTVPVPRRTQPGRGDRGLGHQDLRPSGKARSAAR